MSEPVNDHDFRVGDWATLRVDVNERMPANFATDCIAPFYAGLAYRVVRVLKSVVELSYGLSGSKHPIILAHPHWIRPALENEIRAAIVRESPFKDGDICEALPNRAAGYGTHPPAGYIGTIKHTTRPDGAPSIVFEQYPEGHFLLANAESYLRKLTPDEVSTSPRRALDLLLTLKKESAPAACGNCRFWEHNLCKRRAPVVIVCSTCPERGKQYTEAAWPDTDHRQWCGEHEYAAEA